MRRSFKKAAASVLAAIVAVGSMPLGMLNGSLSEVFAAESGSENVVTVTNADSGTVTDESYFGIDDSGVISYYGRDKNVVIPESIHGIVVTGIASYAFQNNDDLISVTIPEGVTSIGEKAFCDCSSLTSITFPDSITSIGTEAFGYCSSLTSVTIPEGVTSIEKNTFYKCSSLTSVTIPEGVTSIGEYAFGYCSSLMSITIPESVTTIGDSAFYECSGLTSTTISENLTAIGDSTFYGCSSLESIAIPESVTAIGNSAFYNCSSLTSVIIQEGVTSIGYSAFEDCSSLKSLVIPEGVTSIGYATFDGCSSLESITIPSGVDSLAFMFRYCKNLAEINVSKNNETYCSVDGVLFSKDMTELMKYPPKKEDTSYVIPESVEQIWDLAFDCCNNLTSVTISDNGYLRYNIVNGQFTNCDNLTAFKLAEESSYYFVEDGILYANEWSGSHILVAYPAGKKVSDFVVPTKVETIDWRAFAGCDDMNIILLNNVKTIEVRVFENCSNINIIMPENGLDYIDDDVFYGCSDVKVYCYDEALKEALLAQQNSFTDFEVKNINILSDDSSNIQIGYIDDIISSTSKLEASVQEDSDEVFTNYDIVLTDMNGDLVKPNGAVTVKIPCPTGYIGEKCTLNRIGEDGSKTEISVVYSDGYLSFVTDVFGKFTVMNQGLFDFSDGTIQGWNGDASVTEIVIPENIGGIEVTAIGDYAFRDCSNLTSITIPDSVTSIGRYAFWDCSSLKNIIIPKGVTAIELGTFYGCSSLTSVTIPDSVTRIDNLAFYDCSSLTSVTIPKGVTTISNAVFQGCSSLTNITIPEGVTTIEGNAFWDCSSLTSITIPDSVTSIGGYLFYGCDKLKDIYVSEANEAYCVVDGVLFTKDKTSLIKYPAAKEGTSYIIPEGVTSIAGSAFDGCSSLTSITIPEGVTSIGYYAFEGCSSLLNVTIPDGVESIPTEAFLECSSLKTVTIPKSVTSISASAFDKCNSLEAINVEEGNRYYCSIDGVLYRISSYGIVREYYPLGKLKEGEKKPNVAVSDLKIAVEYNSDCFENSIKLNTDLVTDEDEAYKNIIITDKIVDSSVAPENVKLTAYDITLVDSENNAVQPNGTVTVKLPCPADYAGENCKVYRVEDNGVFTDMNAVYSNGYFSFETDHFSLYIITETELKTISNIIYGDANKDGEVDVSDAVLLKKYLAGIKDSEINLDACDVNVSGEVDVSDAVILLKYLAGIKDVKLGMAS